MRHGQARHDSRGLYGPDAPLSELGRRQVASLAASLGSGPEFDALYSSNLPRAVETAEAVAERLGLEIVVDRRLAEFNVDTSQAASFDDRPDLVVWQPEHTSVDGETLAEFASRVAEFHDDIVDRHPGQRIAVICHAGTIDEAIRWSLGIEPWTPLQHEFDAKNASITEIEFWPHGRVRGGAPRYAVLKRIGDVGHLGDLSTEY